VSGFGFGSDIGVYNFKFSDMDWIWSWWKSVRLDQDCKISISVRGVHELDFGFFGSRLRLRPAGTGFKFS